MPHHLTRLGVALVATLTVVDAAYPPEYVPSSWPHDYPGKPSTDLSPAWQDYFEVKDALPNVTWTTTRSFAGNIPVDRPGHPNNTLFFWAVEKQNGSLTRAVDENSSDPWGIWLQGGPGGSSMIGFSVENGPIHINADSSAQKNNFSWNQLADYIWIDQPVGVGYSTADSAGYVHDEDETARDFMNFLTNLVKVFPSLKKRPLHLTGESYAGTYIPYILKAYFDMSRPPVRIVNIAIGDGAIGPDIVYSVVPVVTILETYPQLIAYDPAVLEYFREQEHLCGYDLNLTYPQDGHFPTLQYVNPTARDARLLRAFSRTQQGALQAREVIRQAKRASHPIERSTIPKARDLSARANGTIDPWYGCFLWDEMIDYAVNFSYPWSIAHDSAGGFDVYNIPDALFPEANMDASRFFNGESPLTREGGKNWSYSIPYPFLGDPESNFNDPSAVPMVFLTELAANASAYNISVILYSGNDDSIVAHRIVIQNTTFGGVQGFSQKPSTPWFDDNGERGGIVHQERNWTYMLIEGAGHFVPYTNPLRAFVLAREFIFGNNQTGLVTNPTEPVSVVGGEYSSLAADAIAGQLGIYVGSGTTQSTYTYPSATISAWNSFIATVASTNMPSGVGAEAGGR
ncbi:alpha/beta-hydrolase [Trametes elegans]|nr:alpha/beta-hydrolase [Trametes elegans]